MKQSQVGFFLLMLASCAHLSRRERLPASLHEESTSRVSDDGLFADEEGLGVKRFDELLDHFEKIQKKIDRYAAQHSRYKSFTKTMRNMCVAGAHPNMAQRAEILNIIRKALPNQVQDPSLGIAVQLEDEGTKKIKKYFYSEQDFFMLIATAMSEASGLRGSDDNPRELDNYTHLAQMLGVMYVVKNRMRNDGRDVWRIVSYPIGNFAGWNPGSESHIPCMLAGGNVKWGGKVRERAIRAFQYFQNSKTKFEGDLGHKTYYFARGPRRPFKPTKNYKVSHVNRPIVKFPNGKRVNLYSGVGRESQYHHFWNKIGL